VNPTPQTSAADTFPCAKCGANLSWDAGKRSMHCQFCGHDQPMPVQPSGGMQIREIPLEEGISQAPKGLGAPVTTLKCKDCGATVNVGEGERTAACAFCGSKQVLQIETDANAIRPESLLPFQIDKAAANKGFGDWLKGLWFRPNDLKRMASVQEMGGVYVPFWTFDAYCDSDWTAERGWHYYVTETYTAYENGQQVTRTRQVQRTRWEPAWGNRRGDFYDDMLVCASRGLPSTLVDKFSSFNTKQLVPYAPQYLAGWRAEAYAIDLMSAHGTSINKMADQQQARCGRDVGGDTHRSLVVNNRWYRETFKHVLLPIWIAAYRYNDKVYRFLVNGQTGEVTGEAPYSFWKIFFACLLGAAVIGVIGYFVYQNQTAKQREQEEQQKKQQLEDEKNDDGDDDKPAPKKKGKHGSRAPLIEGRDGTLVVVPV
jgi:DNA-directed RNA polymerase subunit RPC12/RpoP